MGHLVLAYAYAYEAAQIDLQDIDHNSGDGAAHRLASRVWIALVAGFGGLRQHDGLLSSPQLPDGITRPSFTVQWHGLRLGVDIEPDWATYTLRDGPDSSLACHHKGKEVSVTTEKPNLEQISRRSPMLPRPQQPSGREPMHRGEAQNSWIAAGG